MTTTIITYIHEDLQHEAILVRHLGTSEELEEKLAEQFEAYERSITLTDVAIFLMRNSEKYEVINNGYFWKESEFRKSEMFEVARQEIEFASDRYFQIYN